MKPLAHALSIVSFGAALGLFASPAWAAEVESGFSIEPPPARPFFAPARSMETWYGIKILLPSVIFATVSGAMYASDTGRSDEMTDSVLPVLVFGSVVAAPIAHWAEGHGRRGFLSFGIHAMLSFGFGIGGYLIGNPGCEGDIECYRSFKTAGFVGLTLGGLTASVVDASLLAFSDPKPKTDMQARQRGLPLTWNVAPMLAPHTFGLGVTGQF